ncbi:TPT domain-containing protein [Mycena kentingensis (nom. inval.)]|nr:TPT domain-containing protein [Mycena kentingensis (nom. inval.)]
MSANTLQVACVVAFYMCAALVAGLAFNILCLRGVEASYFQIARGLVLPLTILVSWLHNRASPVSSSVLGASAIVTTGFFIGVVPNNDLPASATPSLLSLVYGFLSSLFIAVHAVLIKTSLPYCDNSTIQLAYWTNAGSAVLLLPVVLVAGELSVLYNKMGDAQWNSTVFLWGSSVTGIFGFLLCIAGLLSIRVTSPVTHMISSAARSVLQTLIGVMYFGDIITTFQPRNQYLSDTRRLNASNAAQCVPCSYCTSNRLYTWIKSVEARPQQQPVDIEAQDLDFAKTNAEIERLMSEREEKD